MKTTNKISIYSAFLLIALILLSPLSLAKNDKDKKKQLAEEWYLRTSVSVLSGEVTYQADNPIVVGRLAESSDGFDKHDIRPFSSLVNSKASIFIVQNEWGDNSGEYLSDYRGSKGQSNYWDFSVSALPNAEVSLDWTGVYELASKMQFDQVKYQEKLSMDGRILKRLHLVDLTTLKVVEAINIDGELNRYVFDMGSCEEGTCTAVSRNFMWVLGPVTSNHFIPASGKNKYIKAKQREMKASKAEREQAKSWNANKPPSKFGEVPSAE